MDYHPDEIKTSDGASDALTKPFPTEAIKHRQGGGNRRFSYVEGHTVIRRLIEATGNRFNFRVVDFRSTPAPNNQTLHTATVELCIDGLGCRQHIGVQLVADRAGEDLTKGAVTDGLKKAATLFGVGLELYGPDYEGDGDMVSVQGHTVDRKTGEIVIDGAGVTPELEEDMDRSRKMRALHVCGNDRGLSHEDLRLLAQDRFGVQSMRHLTAQQLHDLRIRIEGMDDPQIADIIRPAVQFNIADWVAAIEGAGTGQELQRVGSQISTLNISEADKTLLRNVYKEEARRFFTP